MGKIKNKIKKIVGAWDDDPSLIRIKDNRHVYKVVGLLAGPDSPNYHLTKRGQSIIGETSGDVMLVLRRVVEQ